MGLGKTIQGIGVAELLAKLADITRVLIVCPASLKSQWRAEIARFSGRSSQIVLGKGEKRSRQYASDTFFTICNYEKCSRSNCRRNGALGLNHSGRRTRIKNWESKTSNVIRQLESPFRLVLSGTPLENRLGELFTVTGLSTMNCWGLRISSSTSITSWTIEAKRLATDNSMCCVKKSADLAAENEGGGRQTIARRTDEIIRCEATAEQKEVHDANMHIVAQIACKKFITEMDRLRDAKVFIDGPDGL